MEEDLLERIERNRRQRDERRPTMEDAVEAVTDIMSRFSLRAVIRQTEFGPQRWAWCDLSQYENGHIRWYLLEPSTMEGAEGYPKITIMTSTAPRLDGWVTIAQLLMGPSKHEMEESFMIGLSNLEYAFAGVKRSIARIGEQLDEQLATMAVESAGQGELN